MTRRRDGKAQLGALLILLLLVGGGGGWNYVRNTKIEEAEFRPYRTYADADLEALLDAYEGQLEERTGHWKSEAKRSVDIRDRDHFDQRVREFERVQAVAQHKRALVTEVAKSQVALEQLKEELRLRKRDRPAYKKVLRRVFTVPL